MEVFETYSDLSEIDYMNQGDTLTLRWSGEDELSGIEKFFEVWFGSIGGKVVIDWSDMLEDTVHYLTGLGLEHVNEYFTQVRITDNAGNESVVFSSDGVLVDLESPYTRRGDRWIGK